MTHFPHFPTGPRPEDTQFTPKAGESPPTVGSWQEVGRRVSRFLSQAFSRRSEPFAQPGKMHAEIKKAKEPKSVSFVAKEILEKEYGKGFVISSRSGEKRENVSLTYEQYYQKVRGELKQKQIEAKIKTTPFSQIDTKKEIYSSDIVSSVDKFFNIPNKMAKSLVAGALHAALEQFANHVEKRGAPPDSERLLKNLFLAELEKNNFVDESIDRETFRDLLYKTSAKGDQLEDPVLDLRNADIKKLHDEYTSNRWKKGETRRLSYSVLDEKGMESLLKNVDRLFNDPDFSKVLNAYSSQL